MTKDITSDKDNMQGKGQQGNNDNSLLYHLQKNSQKSDVFNVYTDDLINS